jgi:hypothetical protein
LLLPTASCRAVNPGFIPGDACFHAILTENYLATLRPAGGNLELHYSYPEPMMGCGYGGFARLTVRNCPPALYDGLTKVYRAVRKTHSKLVRVLEEPTGRRNLEINGLDLFVYNKAIDWKRQEIGLKYNEHWFDFPIKSPRPANGWFGSGKSSERMNAEAYRYVSFLPGPDAVVEDWKNSARIPGLAVRVPDVNGWEFAGPEIEVPVVTNAEDIELIVTCEPLDDYFQRRDESTFYVIRTASVRELQWRVIEGKSTVELTDAPFGAN